LALVRVYQAKCMTTMSVLNFLIKKYSLNFLIKKKQFKKFRA
jgi:hypothetical protein